MTSSEDLINVTFEKNDKIKSVEKILQPSAIVSWLFGAGIARPSKCPKALTLFLRFINFVICSVIVAYGAIDFFIFGSVFKSDTFKIMYYSNKAACYISSYWYVLQGLVQYSKWPLLMENIGEIDRKMKQCGMENSNKLIRKFQFFTLVAIITLGPVSLISHAIYYYYIRPEDIFASDLLLYHTIAQSLVMNFNFDLVVCVIYSRFETLNQRINQIADQFAPEAIVMEIRRVREIHQGLKIYLINDFYISYKLYKMSHVQSYMIFVYVVIHIYLKKLLIIHSHI